MAEAEITELPWHAAFPNPKSVAGAVSREQVLQWLQQGKSDFILIDLRRTDCDVSGTFRYYFFLDFVLNLMEPLLLTERAKGGIIRGSINLPAQSLYYTIPALYKLFKAANLAKVIWFCGEPSCSFTPLYEPQHQGSANWEVGAFQLRPI
jgi:arsenical-resistance protein 2